MAENDPPTGPTCVPKSRGIRKVLSRLKVQALKSQNEPAASFNILISRPKTVFNPLSPSTLLLSLSGAIPDTYRMPELMAEYYPLTRLLREFCIPHQNSEKFAT